MVKLQSVQGHTGLTLHFFSRLSIRVPKCQKINKGVLDQYGPGLFGTHFCHNQKSRKDKLAITDELHRFVIAYIGPAVQTYSHILRKIIYLTWKETGWLF